MNSLLILLALAVLQTQVLAQSSSAATEAELLFSQEQEARREALKKSYRKEADLIAPLLVAERAEVMIVRRDNARSAAAKRSAIREIKKKFWLKRNVIHEAISKERDAMLSELRRR